jgi:hypothetical protein
MTIEVVGKWQECVAAFLEEDGYMVCGSKVRMEVGKLVPRDRTLPYPMRVCGPATYEDAMRQLRIAELICGEELEEPPRPAFFYKTVVAD